jgi:hypothetical protein
MNPRNRPRVAYREHSARRAPGAVYTILSFCASNAISPSKYYSLKRQGRGPVEIDLDGRIIITPESEQAWRREREAESQARRAEREAADDETAA